MSYGIPGFYRSRLIALASQVLLLTCANEVLGGVEVTGSITHETYDPNGSKDSSVSQVFTAYIEDCRWRIRTSGGSREIAYCEWAYDGTNIYQYTLINSNAVTARPNSMFANAAITAEAVPRYDPSYIAVVWLVYASKCYLAENATTGRLKPIWYVDRRIFELDDFSVKAFVSNERGYPARIVFFNDLPVHKITPAGKIEVEERSSPYDRGLTNAVFTASNLKELDGGIYPESFRLEVLIPTYASRTVPVVRTYYALEGKADAITIKRGKSSDIRPELPTAATIRDERVTLGGDSRAIVYSATNWPAVSSSLINHAVKEQALIQRLQPKTVASRGNLRWTVVVALVVVTTVFGIITWRFSVKR